MSEHRCEKLTPGTIYPQCINTAKYFENGRHYCGIHAPSRIEARRQKKKDDKQARHDKLHADPEFIKSQISLCEARIEAHERELAEWKAKLEAVT